MGNDCSQRVCYFGKAFVDTPLGDLNSDGEIHALDSVPVMFANKPQIEMFPNEYGVAKFDSTSDESWAEALDAVNSGIEPAPQQGASESDDDEALDEYPDL